MSKKEQGFYELELEKFEEKKRASAYIVFSVFLGIVFIGWENGLWLIHVISGRSAISDVNLFEWGVWFVLIGFFFYSKKRLNMYASLDRPILTIDEFKPLSRQYFTHPDFQLTYLELEKQLREWKRYPDILSFINLETVTIQDAFNANLLIKQFYKPQRLQLEKEQLIKKYSGKQFTPEHQNEWK